jgi:hypothetical protein
VLPTLGRNFWPAQQKNSKGEKKRKEKEALIVAMLFNSVADLDPHPNLDP